MPPLKGIDRGLDGDALRALERSGHGRRLAIVDPSYNIPRWAETVAYHGQSSADALVGIVRLVPVDEGEIGAMIPDPDNREDRAHEAFKAINKATDKLNEEDSELELYVWEYARLDSESLKGKGFYSVANNQEADTLFVRTRDELPYACATFVIGHSQVPEDVQEELERQTISLGYASFDEFSKFADSHPELGTSQVPGMLWGMLMRTTRAHSSREEKRGFIVRGSQEFEVFKIEPFARTGYLADPMRQRAIGYSMNLDTLELLVEGGYLLDIPMLGPKHQRLSSEFIEARKANPEELTNT